MSDLIEWGCPCDTPQPVIEPGDPRNACPRHLVVSLRSAQVHSGGRVKPMPAPEALPIPLSSSEAAQAYGYAHQHLNSLLARGKIPGHREGRIWMTTDQAVEAYIAGLHPQGRRRKRG